MEDKSILKINMIQKIFEKDYLFLSASAVARVFLDRNTNGELKE